MINQNLGKIMNRTKIIVQGIPSRAVGSALFDPVSKIRERTTKYLTQLFSQFGPVHCIYMPPHAPNDDFAHLTFENFDDALAAWNAGQRHEIAIEDELVTLTLVADDEEPIEVLKDDCLMKIFVSLDAEDRLAVEKVCKRWEQLALRSWYNMTSVSFESYCTLEKMEAYILRCGPYLRELTFPTIYESPQSSLSLVKDHCQNVQKINIFMKRNYMDEDKLYSEFSAMLSNLKNLKQLKCENIRESFRFDFVDNLPADMSEICLSAVSYSPFFSGPVSVAIDVSRFRNLTGLLLNYFVVDEGALRGLGNLDNLTYVIFEKSRVHHSIVESLDHLTKLQKLVIANCQINDDVLLNIVANNRELQFLDISCIQQLTDRSLMAISGLPKLEQLHMSDLPNVQLNFMDPMPQLKQLDCSCCSSITEEYLRRIVETSPKLELFNILGYLVSYEFFAFAKLTTNTRDSGVILTIKTTRRYYIDEDTSPFLRIDCPRSEDGDYDDYHNDDADYYGYDEDNDYDYDRSSYYLPDSDDYSD